jgi:hypothetical protein
VTQKDLTRWNRAGLSRFDYVQGNAATYLERLRASLYARFPGLWEERLLPPQTGEESETKEDWIRLRANEILRERYLAERGDIGWEIVRSFARACHVLTGHINAHANEAYLRTATQWESVRRLVSTLDYHPPGATSASALIALKARPGAKGVVKKGLQLRYSPSDGGAPIIFETMDDVPIDASLNELKPEGHEVSTDQLLSEGQSAKAAGWVAPSRPKILTGEAALITWKDEAGIENLLAVTVDKVDGSGTLEISNSDEWRDLTRGSARLRVAPRWKRRAWMNGAGVIRTNQPHGFSAGDVAVWAVGEGWRFAEVEEAGAYVLRFKQNVSLPVSLPDTGTELRRAVRIKDAKVLSIYVAAQTPEGKTLTLERPDPDKTIPIKEFNTNDLIVKAAQDLPESNNPLLFPDDIVKAMLFAVGVLLKDIRIPSTQETIPQALLSLGQVLSSIASSQAEPPDGSSEQAVQPGSDAVFFVSETSDLLTCRLDPIAEELWVLFPSSPGSSVDNPKVVEVVDSRRYVFDGSSRDLSLHSDVAASIETTAGTKWYPAKITEIIDPIVLDEDRRPPAAFAVDLAGLPAGKLVELHGNFDATEIAPEKANVNAKPVGDALRLPVGHGLRPGQTVLSVAGTEARPVTIASVEKTETEAGIPVASVKLSQTLPAGFTQGNLSIYGNVVHAGHGERKPARYLSGGSASNPLQSLLLDVKEIATIEDLSHPRRVRPDVDVIIGAETWRQVPSLDNSRPADAHFTTRTTEAGYLELRFGDGRQGRQLPAGTNNVQVRYRQGAGRRGLRGAGCLVELSQPHPLVERVLQPLPTQFGEDAQPRTRIREQAPAAVMALDRAVSVADFESIAQNCPDIVQARARFVSGGAGRYDLVQLTIVPVGGAELAPLDPLLDRLAGFFQERAVPTIRVSVTSFARKVVPLRVDIRVDTTRFSGDQVARTVRTRLLEGFCAEKRRIGEPLYLSELYSVVESIEEVADSHCQFFQSKASNPPIDATVAQPNDAWLPGPAADPARALLVLSDEWLQVSEPTRYVP